MSEQDHPSADNYVAAAVAAAADSAVADSTAAESTAADSTAADSTAADTTVENSPAINPADVRLAAMNLLARREHSLRELRQKLRRRFSDGPLLEAELHRLADENLQSDQRFAESYARQRAGRGYGPQRVRQEMRDRGLSEADIASAFERNELDWFALAEEVFRKKFDARAVPDTQEIGLQPPDLKEKARRARFMQYRGFSTDHFRHLLGD